MTFLKGIACKLNVQYTMTGSSRVQNLLECHQFQCIMGYVVKVNGIDLVSNKLVNPLVNAILLIEVTVHREVCTVSNEWNWLIYKLIFCCMGCRNKILIKLYPFFHFATMIISSLGLKLSVRPQEGTTDIHKV